MRKNSAITGLRRKGEKSNGSGASNRRRAEPRSHSHPQHPEQPAVLYGGAGPPGSLPHAQGGWGAFHGVSVHRPRTVPGIICVRRPGSRHGAGRDRHLPSVPDDEGYSSILRNREAIGLAHRQGNSARQIPMLDVLDPRPGQYAHRNHGDAAGIHAGPGGQAVRAGKFSGLTKSRTTVLCYLRSHFAERKQLAYGI